MWPLGRKTAVETVRRFCRNRWILLDHGGRARGMADKCKVAPAHEQDRLKMYSAKAPVFTRGCSDREQREDGIRQSNTRGDIFTSAWGRSKAVRRGGNRICALKSSRAAARDMIFSET